ncbi:VOC family protein [Synechococcus sp. PCC 6312]|uniref:VOC family protein n=1 Tax=Synechococcus sp. (strain ATCC 27167 / PCC 6312) TaxID=195253 RepID=UPI00059B898D|nr:VOC family protein [Synechococcus sp. PCC 6312]
MHHVSIRTAQIHQALAFYQLLGFEVEVRFTTGETLACWITGFGSRLELIQIPKPAPPPDAFFDPHYVGYYHLSFDLTDHLEPGQTLGDWLASLEIKVKEQGLVWKLLLPITEQVIGDQVYDVAFIQDRDGLPLEFLEQKSPPV